MKLWMVEQRWKLANWPAASIRSVVKAKTKREAQKGAAKAIQDAVKVLMPGGVRGKALGSPVVLYPLMEGS